MTANNQGIVHLRVANQRIACNRRRAHMAVDFDRFDAQEIKCKNCEVHFARIVALKARKAATNNPL